ncbi:MAG: hypothetical protein K2X29_01330 [Candidatus Obscuribacterales bacterium]|nr:hypothetical protein [Candidatus Obscuribacterales bacterium]
MGSAKMSSQAENVKLASVSTTILKDRLNGLYRAMQRRPETMVTPGLFEYLWDLKELALLEGKPSVEVPEPWLAELEDTCCSVSNGPRLN